MNDRSVIVAEAALEAARDALAVARRAHDAALEVVGEAALTLRKVRREAARKKLH
jgi:hypothetical protein